MIQAQLSAALGCEPPSVTLMTRKLEASGHIRRNPAVGNKRATVVHLTDLGTELVGQIKRMWCELAEETVDGLPAETVAKLPGILRTLTENVDTRRPRSPLDQAGRAAHHRRTAEVDHEEAPVAEDETGALAVPANTSSGPSAPVRRTS
ncbi:MarR family winged helix-turn-helix transcriptional regulator [Actinomycetes bacterium KLBMP 9759]